MILINSMARSLKQCRTSSRMYTLKIAEPKFEPVFTLPAVKYVALFNRLKVYHIIGSSVAVPSCGLLEMFNVLAEQTFSSAISIGITGAAVLSLASLPFKNIIGFLYISEDNKFIKISSVNYWGKRDDRVIPADDWTPLFDIGPKKTDVLYLSPHLTDNTKYKLFIKFGNVLNAKKMGEVLD